MNKEWLDFLQQELSKDYMVELKKFIDTERQTKKVVPDSSITFNYMNLCPYDRLKVIIIGDAPFPEGNDGLAFSYNGFNPPEENKDLLYEAFRDYFGAWPNNVEVRKRLFPTTNLMEWAKQGVLLMNMVNTCTEDRFAHRMKGWESFNTALLRMLNDYPLGLVIVNKSGHNLKDLFNPKKHLYLTSDETKWCTKANDFIRKRNVPISEQYHQLKINWTTKQVNV